MTFFSRISGIVQLTRPFNASGGILTFSIGYVIAGSSFQSGYFVGLLILLLLHSMGTVQNDLVDKDIDAANKRASALQQKILPEIQAKWLAFSLGAFALITASLASPSRPLHLIASCVMLVCIWAYNNKPLRTSKKPISSIVTMSICYGALPFAYGYLVAGGSTTRTSFIVFAFVWFLARFSTSILKDYKDAHGDKMMGKNTFYLRYGKLSTARISLGSSFLAYVGLLFTLPFIIDFRLLTIIPLLLVTYLAANGILLRHQLSSESKESRLNSLFHRIVFRHNQMEAAVLACLIISIL